MAMTRRRTAALALATENTLALATENIAIVNGRKKLDAAILLTAITGLEHNRTFFGMKLVQYAAAMCTDTSVQVQDAFDAFLLKQCGVGGRTGMFKLWKNTNTSMVPEHVVVPQHGYDAEYRIAIAALSAHSASKHADPHQRRRVRRGCEMVTCDGAKTRGGHDKEWCTAKPKESKDGIKARNPSWRGKRR